MAVALHAVLGAQGDDCLRLLLHALGRGDVDGDDVTVGLAVAHVVPSPLAACSPAGDAAGPSPGSAASVRRVIP